jgi:hypothetical protein
LLALAFSTEVAMKVLPRVGENGPVHPLITEAMKKAAVAWLEVGGQPAYPVWCLWSDGALYVVSGPGEQPAPGLAEATTATVHARGDHGGRIVAWAATVERVPPDSEQWSTVVPQLAGKRLNSAPTGELVSRWAADAVVNRLAPPPGQSLDSAD